MKKLKSLLYPFYFLALTDHNKKGERGRGAFPEVVGSVRREEMVIDKR